MDANMTKYASLLQAARADQELGDFKSAYTIYLKAYAIITRMLETQVVFKDKGSLESVPDNYSQLVAHAQEILRRIKDIVEQSKSHTPKAVIRTVSSSSSLTSQPRQQQPQSRSSSATAARPGPGSSLPSQSSITSSSQIKKLSKKNIPMIPISPLTKQALINAYALSQATQRFEQAKQGSSPQQPAGMRNLANLRRLIEDVRIQNAKLDAVKAQIQSVSTSTITSWDPDSIARQLTIVDTQLFKDVTVPKDLVRADRKTSQAQHCIDFETYIAHSVAHLLLLEWSVSRHPSPVTTPATSKNHVHLPVNAVAHMIKVAHILLHVYRNFNSFMAVMRALTSPEIKRMRKSWSGVNSKTKDQFKKLVLIYIAKDNARCYKETLIQKLDAFQDVGKDAVVALPWMRHHMDEVKSIINSYMTGHESTGGSSDVVLSAPGARKLSAVTALLVQCRTNEPGALDRQDVDDKHSQSAFNAKHREPIVVEGLKTPLTPIWDLTSLGTGDIALHHWLLSRPFLNKQQLIDESLEIEPLFHGEELPCYDASFDSDDNGEDDTVQDDFEHVIAPEHDLESLLAASTARSNETPSRSRTPVSETEINDIMNELLNNDNGDSKDLFDDIGGTTDEEGEEVRASDKYSKAKGSPGRTEDVLKFLGIDPDEYSDSDHDDNDGGDKAQPAIKSGKGKGKGKARDVDDTEEIDTLLAQVKGLVRESRSHAEEVESKSTLTEFDLDEQEIDGGIAGGDKHGDDADQHHGSSRTFEPSQQEHEEDEFGFQAPKPTLAATSDPAPASSLLSLDAMRLQLQSIGLEAPYSQKAAETTTASTVAQHAYAQESNVAVTEGSSQVVSPVSGDGHNESDTKADLMPPTSPTSSSMSPASASVNPFAPYMVKKIVTNSSSSQSTSPETPSGTISRGRRRKIQTDRSAHLNDTGETVDAERTRVAFSPPRPDLAALGLDASDSSLERIAALAKQSLASHGEKKPLDKIQSPRAMEIPHALIDEVDKNPLGNSPPALRILSSSSPTASATTTTTQPHTDILDSESESFQLGASLLGTAVESATETNATTESGSRSDEHDKHRSTEVDGDESSHANRLPESAARGREDRLNVEVEGDGAGVDDTGSAGSIEGGRARSRQRRRIAGGVISVPPKSLMSKASTASLSGAFQEQVTVDAAESTSPSLLMEVADGERQTLTDDIGQHHHQDQATKAVEANTTSIAEDDVVTTTVLAEVEMDVTASEENSPLTKSLPEASSDAGTDRVMQQQQQQQTAESILDQDEQQHDDAENK